MRKKNTKEKRNKMIIGIIITFIMVSSIGGFVILNSTTNRGVNKFTLTYSNIDYEFTRKQDNMGNLYYEVSSERGIFTIFYLPQQLNIEVDEESINLIKNSPFYYLTFNPDDAEISYIDYLRFDFQKNIPREKFFQDSVTQTSSVYSLPVITCNNATINTPVILLKNSNFTNISSMNNCVTVEFAPYNTLQIRDLLVYLFQGIDISSGVNQNV